ncbi:Ribosome maturation factor RimP [bacterium HR08]|nr:Ribosome maturation factor RimP [bacterium HR08]
MNLVERVTTIIEPVIAALGFELVHVEITGGRRGMTLRVLVDKPGGITVEECARVSERIGVVLDVEDPIPHRYVLEVCSPGIERGLYRKSDYARFAGRTVKIETWEQIEGRRHFTGELIGIQGDEVTVRERELKRDVVIPYPKIRRAHLAFEWGKSEARR